MVRVNGRSTKKQTASKPKKARARGQLIQPIKRQEIDAANIPTVVAKHPYAYARLDPFDQRARGAKVPDFDNNASAAGDFVFDLGMSTNANGNGCVVVPFWPCRVIEVAQWNNTASRFELTTGGVGVLAQSGGYFSGWDECIGCRVVGAGMKIRSGMNDNNVSGNMYIVPMSLLEMKTWKAQGTTGGYTFTDLKNRKGTIKKTMSEMTKGQEVKCVSTVLDPTAFSYINPDPVNDPMLATGAEQGDAPNYMGFVVVVEGPVSLVVADLQIVLHLEWIPGKNFQFMTSRAEPANTALLEKINNYAEQAPSIITTLGDIAGNVFNAVQTGMKVAGTLGLLAL